MFLWKIKNNKYLSICDLIDGVYSQLIIDKINANKTENKEDIIIKINININKSY